MENNENKTVLEAQANPRTMKGYAIAAMALGIGSIVGEGTLLCIAAAIIALVFAAKIKKAGEEWTFAKVGKITAYVGLGIQAFEIITSIIAVIFLVCYYVILIAVMAIVAATEGNSGWEYYYEFDSFARNVALIWG